jgi:hypothetical protein
MQDKFALEYFKKNAILYEGKKLGAILVFFKRDS